MADGGLTPDVPVEALTRSLARGKRTTINPRRVSRESLEAGRLQYPDVGQHADRPRTRGECEHDVLPCPWVSCKHHLYLDVDERTGSIKLNFPGREVWELRETCALRVADRDGETLEEIAELMRVFLPDGTNEARLIDQVDATITKVVDLGFLRRLKPAAGGGQDRGHYEVRRILKAFVDAQWLAEFDARLDVYRTALSGGAGLGAVQEKADA